MLDNRKYKLRKLAGRGWEDMRRQLDREMPVAPGSQRPRRAAIWWPAAAALLLGLAAGAALNHHFSRPGTPAPAAGLPGPAAPAGTTVRPSPGLAAAGAQAELPAAILAGRDASSATQANLPRSLRKPQNAVLAPLNLENAGSLFLQGSQPATVLATPAQATALATTRAGSGLLTTDRAEATAPTPSRPGGVEVPPLLATPRPARPLASMEIPALSVPLQLPAGPSSRWELYLGGLMPDYFGAGGVSLGILTSRAIKGSRYSKELGLGYSYLIQPMTVTFMQGQELTATGNQVAGQDEFTVLSTSLGNQRTADAGGSSARFLKPLQLHYLELPFSLVLRANSRLRLRLGLLASLMLASKSDYTSGGLFGAGPGASQLQADAMSASINYVGMSPARELKVFDLSAMAGLDIQLSPTWSIGLSSQYGMLDMIPGNGRRDFNRLLRFTFRRSV